MKAVMMEVVDEQQQDVDFQDVEMVDLKIQVQFGDKDAEII
ncbi:unnamed protein product [Schistosoma mattheei]|uniref:Uncharacterized protein n=1 Tax=Schistosoma mattheei TaxID=31246 RepID=A0A183PXC3_9TREM|nr:unnamed protein product [Schistosoma mattheei]